MIVEKVCREQVCNYPTVLHHQNIVLSAICSLIVVFQWRIFCAWQETLFTYSVSSRRIVCVLKTSWLISLKYTFITGLGLALQGFFKFRCLSSEAYAVRNFLCSIRSLVFTLSLY
jgi:ABC-type transporter Mla maintaining outer membrane lipid asymmetry permease subunit MlaE